VDPIRLVLEKARTANVPIIYTQDHHRVTDREIRAGTKPHTLEGTWGEQILEVIKPRPQDYVVQKNAFDPWFSSDELEHILTRRLTHIRYAVVVGLVSDFCVYATANGFGIRGYEVILPKDCTEASSDYGKELTLRQMRVLYHAQITDSEALLFK
jgi:nicotinamidase-related amidase